jgi:hypothetical protein
MSILVAFEWHYFQAILNCWHSPFKPISEYFFPLQIYHLIDKLNKRLWWWGGRWFVKQNNVKDTQKWMFIWIIKFKIIWGNMRSTYEVLMPSCVTIKNKLIFFRRPWTIYKLANVITNTKLIFFLPWFFSSLV